MGAETSLLNLGFGRGSVVPLDQILECGQLITGSQVVLHLIIQGMMENPTVQKSIINSAALRFPA